MKSRGNDGTNKGLRRFSLRGKKKVQGQWQLFVWCKHREAEELRQAGGIKSGNSRAYNLKIQSDLGKVRK
jgi:hypothetical protein